MNVYLVIEEYDGEFGEHVKGVYFTRDDAVDAVVENHDVTVEEFRKLLMEPDAYTDEDLIELMKDDMRSDLETFGITDTVPAYRVREVPMGTWGVGDDPNPSFVVEEDEEENSETRSTDANTGFNFDDYMDKRF